MEGVNLKYNVTAEVLTPLSVGQGSEKDWVEGIDYVVKNDMMYHLDLSKMYAAGIDMERVANLFQKQDAEGVHLLIGEKLEQVSDFKMPMPCRSSNPIKTFFRNQLTNHPVLPGSSLKGAIRSVLFTYLRDSERDNASVFGNMKDGSDFMRFIRVGDFEFPARSTELVNTKIYNLQKPNRNWEGGWKKQGGFENLTTYKLEPSRFNTIYECLSVGSKVHGNIMLSQLLFKLLCQIHFEQRHIDKKKVLFRNLDYPEAPPMENLMYIINCHTHDYLKKELVFFSKYHEGEHATKIITGINNLIKKVETCMDDGNDSCIIKLSAGSGFHAITGDWQFDDYVSGVLRRDIRNPKENSKPKSRKIAITQEGENTFFDLMGFVKLTFED